MQISQFGESELGFTKKASNWPSFLYPRSEVQAVSFDCTLCKEGISSTVHFYNGNVRIMVYDD